MIHSRRELMAKTIETYRTMFSDIAADYYEKRPQAIIDTVGFSCTELEALLRPLWGIAPVLLEEPELTFRYGRRKIRVRKFITEVMKAGTDPRSERFFSRDVTEETRVNFANQAITEITAYLVAVNFAKEILWDPLSDQDRKQIGNWILTWAMAALRDSWPNNHYWYPVFCLEILGKLGFDISEVRDELKTAYGFLDRLYAGNGWYSDGEAGRYDYYEAWAHHTYTLLWILVADKNQPGYEERAQLYRERSTEFLNFFAHFFDEDGGMAAFGRSICYRFAACAPFGLAVIAGCAVDPGLASRVIYKNFNYFYENCLMTDGRFPIGYLYEAPGFTESYISKGSAVNFTESYLVLLAGADHPLFRGGKGKLPIEENDYLLPVPVPGECVSIRGEKKSGVTVFNASLHYYQRSFFDQRFNDLAGSYSKFAYNSRAGYGLSSSDNVSSDNMISLITPGGLMQSHRRRILDAHTEDGWLVSSHIPFENDPETLIVTKLLPLTDGLHLLLHEVKLAGSYIVREGGFSVGMRDDGFTVDIPEKVPAGGFGAKLIYEKKVSAIRCLADTEEDIVYGTERIHPGMHLLAPQAYYPCYRTAVLEPGVYHFLTAVYFGTDGKTPELPLLHLGETGAEAVYGKKHYRIGYSTES